MSARLRGPPSLCAGMILPHYGTASCDAYLAVSVERVTQCGLLFDNITLGLPAEGLQGMINQREHRS